jgi:hypothetical protein
MGEPNPQGVGELDPMSESKVFAFPKPVLATTFEDMPKVTKDAGAAAPKGLDMFEGAGLLPALPLNEAGEGTGAPKGWPPPNDVEVCEDPKGAVGADGLEPNPVVVALAPKVDPPLPPPNGAAIPELGAPPKCCPLDVGCTINPVGAGEDPNVLPVVGAPPKPPDAGADAPNED